MPESYQRNILLPQHLVQIIRQNIRKIDIYFFVKHVGIENVSNCTFYECIETLNGANWIEEKSIKCDKSNDINNYYECHIYFIV